MSKTHQLYLLKFSKIIFTIKKLFLSRFIILMAKNNWLLRLQRKMDDFWFIFCQIFLALLFFTGEWLTTEETSGFCLLRFYARKRQLFLMTKLLRAPLFLT